MGQLYEKHGMILFDKTPPDTCPMCAVEHDPAMPHNLHSLAYQYKFYDKYGRWPTWADAIAHCADDIQVAWREALAEYGIVVDAEPKTATVEIEITVEDEGRDALGYTAKIGIRGGLKSD